MYLNYLNSYLTYNIWFFNFLMLGAGLYVIIDYYKNYNPLQDCSHIFPLICLSLGGNVLPVLTFSQLSCVNIIIFMSSTALVSYNIYNFFQIDSDCSQYYNNKYRNLWILYLVGFILHSFNIIFYLGKFIIFTCWVVREDRQNMVERNRLLNDENIYEN